MKINFMPQSRSGKWSVGFGIVLVISMVLSLIFAVVIGGDPAVIATSPLLSILNVTLNLTLNLAGLLSLLLGTFTPHFERSEIVVRPLAEPRRNFGSDILNKHRRLVKDYGFISYY